MITDTSFQEAVRAYCQQFSERGYFTLKKDDDVRECVARHKVPNSPGVYVISGPDRSVLYIGKSGTVSRDGSFSKQGIQRRLSMKQDGVYRHVYFREQMEKYGLRYLEFRWFVTHDGKRGILPAKAEADLLQMHFDAYGCLPAWNKSL